MQNRWKNGSLDDNLMVVVSVVRQQFPHLSTAVARRKKKFKHFVFNKYFSLVLGVLKSKISKKSFEPLLRKLDFKLFHYKARVQLGYPRTKLKIPGFFSQA